MTKKIDHAKNYRDAVAALEGARVEHSAFERKRSQNPYEFREYDPSWDATKLALLKSEIALHDAAAALNGADPALVTLRAWLVAALDQAADRYAEIERLEKEGKPAPLVEVTASALDVFAAASRVANDPDVRRKARDEVARDLAAAFAAYGNALRLLRDDRKAAGLPSVPTFYNGTRLSLFNGAPVHLACTSANACRELADDMRTHEPNDPAEPKRSELRLLELRIEDYEDRVEREAIERVERVRSYERQYGT